MIAAIVRAWRRFISSSLRGAEERNLERLTDLVNSVYAERNQLVAALARCYPSGTRRTAIPGWSEEWLCVFVDLPTGQASWHYHEREAALFADLPPYTKPYDGHSTEEKYRRLKAAFSTWEANAP